MSVTALLAEDGRFSTLLGAVNAADLTTTLEASEGITCSRPTDEAFGLCRRER